MRFCSGVSRSRGTGHDQHVSSRWTWVISSHSMLEDSKFLQSGSHSGAGHSWPLIPPSFPVEGRWHASDRRRPTPNSVRSGPLGGVGRRGWRLMGRRDCSVHRRAGECAGGVGALHPQRSDGCSMDPPVECNACVQRCRNIRFVSDGPTPRAGHW